MDVRNYNKNRIETAKHMKSFMDGYGKICTMCNECVKKDCKTRVKGSSCMNGELKPDLLEKLKEINKTK